MATKRTTFTKTQRERDKRAKAAAKEERRQSRVKEPVEVVIAADEDQVMADLATLHERYNAGVVSLDEFLIRRDELLAHLVT
jgi:hypothetical protein